MTSEKKIDALTLALEKANTLIRFQRHRMMRGQVWCDALAESFAEYEFAYDATQDADESLSAWRQMDDLTWLDYVIRNLHRVRSNGESEDEDMLICDVALHGFFGVTIKAHSVRDLILKGQQYEQTQLKRPSQKKGETDGEEVLQDDADV